MYFASPNNNPFGTDGLFLVGPTGQGVPGITQNGGAAAIQIRANLTYLVAGTSVTAVAIGVS
jgi:hypothetical protein